MTDAENNQYNYLVGRVSGIRHALLELEQQKEIAHFGERKGMRQAIAVLNSIHQRADQECKEYFATLNQPQNERQNSQVTQESLPDQTVEVPT